MIALIDIGNTRLKYCLVDQGKRGTPQSISNQLLSSAYLSEHFGNITKVIVASVSHQNLTNTIELWCTDKSVDYQRVVSEKSKDEVISAYHQPNQLGVDRWLTLIAANVLYPNKNTLIVDAGTATTIDLIASNGVHQGGWILAGIDTLFSCVLDNTSQVHAKVDKEASLSWGMSTSENVNNATWAATVGAVNLAVSQSEHQGIPLDNILLTGGNGKTLASLLGTRCTVVEDLVFIGLQAYINH